MRYAIPICYIIVDDEDAYPEVLLVEADNKREAIEEAFRVLKERESDIQIWQVVEDPIVISTEGQEEGYIVGHPVKIQD